MAAFREEFDPDYAKPTVTELTREQAGAIQDIDPDEIIDLIEIDEDLREAAKDALDALSKLTSEKNGNIISRRLPPRQISRQVTRTISDKVDT